MFPTINPLVVTGRVSGIIILDQDSVEAYVTLAKRGGIPPTVTVQTPRGEFHEHYWFRSPIDLGIIHNFAGGYDHDLPDIDLRADGGVAVYPGGVNSAGCSYTFRKGRGPGEIEIADLRQCQWLYEYVKDHNEKLAAQEAERQTMLAEAERIRALRAESVVLRLRHYNGDHNTRLARYAEVARQRQLERLANSPPGSRNNQLNRAAYALAAFLSEGVWTEVELEADLEHAAIQVGLDKDPNCGLSGIRRTIASGVRAGRRNRVVLPDRSFERAR